LLNDCEQTIGKMLLPDGSKKKKTTTTTIDANRLTSCLFMIGELVSDGANDASARRKPVERTVTLIVALCARRPPAGIVERFGSAGVPTRARAHAFVALGKLCLQDARLASRYLGTFTQQLQLLSNSGSVNRRRHKRAI
jgi:hypothetical protein